MVRLVKKGSTTDRKKAHHCPSLSSTWNFGAPRAERRDKLMPRGHSVNILVGSKQLGCYFHVALLKLRQLNYMAELHRRVSVCVFVRVTDVTSPHRGTPSRLNLRVSPTLYV